MPFEPAAPPPLAAPYRPPPGPVDVGTLISHVFSIWKKHVWLFAGFMLVALLPVIAIAAGLGLTAALGARSGGEPDPLLIGSIVAIVLPVVWVAMLVNMGGLTYAAIQSMADRPVSFGAMFSVGFRRLLPMLGAGILAGILVGLGFVLLIVPGVIVALGLSIVIPVVVAERVGPIEALKRAWNLTSGYKGTLFGFVIVLGLINFGIAIVAGIIGLIPILGTIASLLIQLLTASLGTIWPAIAYHDIRVAKEGVGTDELAKVFE